LHRCSAGPFTDASSITLEALSGERGTRAVDVLDHHLLPVDAPAQSLPLMKIPEEAGFYFCQGQPIMHTKAYRLCAEGDMVRVFLDSGDFLGVGKITADGQIAPRRLVNRAQQLDK
jgi:tRNA pseudouridine55 synthase